VSSTGTIFVPYLEEVVVSGMTPEQARFAIQTALAPIVPSAQVQLDSQAGRKNSVDLVSGVARPGSYPLPDRNYSILSLIAAGGGIAPSLRNPLVRLIRDGAAFEIPSARLFAEAATNITLRGGDQVLVEEDRRYFTALGASGQEELIYFRKEGLSALEALSEMGGLAETRANPKGVLVLREYPAAALRADGSGPQKSQVVFAFDLTSADGLFAARNFEINPRDTVLATESPVSAARTIIGLFGTVIGVANAAGNI
jgi:polysaccharide export outer membrane protein